MGRHRRRSAGDRRRDLSGQQQYPYQWDREARPSGRRGKRCRIVASAQKGLGQDLVMIEFRGGGRFLVQRAGLKRT